MAVQLQMTWQPSLLSQKRKTGPPLGLKNLGNSCYLNSVLQCLTYTPPLANFCLRNQHSSLCDSSEEEGKRDCPFCLLEKRIVRSLRLEQNLDAPWKIQSCLSVFAEHFRCGRQEDAHEFLRYVIDACHNTCLRLKKLRRKGGDATTSSGGNTVVKEIFGGTLQSQVKCLSCGNESNKVDDIMDISLDVLSSSSLKDAMQKFFQPEVLDGNNKYKCDNCKKLVAAKKQMSILQAPNVLVIQLKRFEGIFGSKIDKAIAFGEFLVLSSFMCKASQDPQPEYKLFGTIVHSGYSPESGHYYAYIKDAMDRWYCCNDSDVSLATLQEVLSEKVYILFFSRTNQRHVSISNGLASNGVKSHHCNGSQVSECAKNGVSLKRVHVKPNAEQTSRKDMPTSSKIDKAPSSPQVKFNINGDSNSKRSAAIVNGKVDVSKIQSVVTNGHVKDSISVENGRKDPSSLPMRNNFAKNKVDAVDSISLENGRKDPSSLPSRNDFTKNKVDAVDNSKRKEPVLSNGNTDVQCVNNHHVNSDLPEVLVYSDLTEVTANSDLTIDNSKDIITGRGPDYHKLESNGLNKKPEVLGNKRKVHEGNCILLACDDQSRARVQQLKDILGKDASAVLRSCGWTDKVYDFMHSRKKLQTQEFRNLSSRDERKKSIIADAKRAFLSKIPESLKEDLIEHLRSFNQDEVQSGGSRL